MNGIELMLSRMIGMKPDEMRAKVEEALSVMKNGAEAAARIQNDLNMIKAHLGIENVAQETINNVGTIADNGRSANGHRIQL